MAECDCDANACAMLGMCVAEVEVKKRWWHLFTGCRPMTYLGYVFTDMVTHNPVFYFKTSDGKIYMAENEWSRFRIEVYVVD